MYERDQSRHFMCPSLLYPTVFFTELWAHHFFFQVGWQLHQSSSVGHPKAGITDFHMGAEDMNLSPHEQEK